MLIINANIQFFLIQHRLIPIFELADFLSMNRKTRNRNKILRVFIYFRTIFLPEYQNRHPAYSSE